MLDRLDASFGGRSRSVPGTRSAWPSGATARLIQTTGTG